MSRCLILMLPLTRLPSLYHRLEKEKQRKYEQQIHEVEWDVLPLWCFQLLGECLLLVTFFSRDLPHYLLTKRMFLMMW